MKSPMVEIKSGLFVRVEDIISVRSDGERTVRVEVAGEGGPVAHNCFVPDAEKQTAKIYRIIDEINQWAKGYL